MCAGSPIAGTSSSFPSPPDHEFETDRRAEQFPIAVAERHDLSGLSNAVDVREHMVARLGILGVTMTSEIRQMLPVRVATGVVVASTVAGAADARDGGFAPGDVICDQPRAGERTGRAAHDRRWTANRRSRCGAGAATRRVQVPRVHCRVTPTSRCRASCLIAGRHLSSF